VPYAHDLAPDERRELLRIARATLREYADSQRIPPGKPHRASLVAPAIVTVALAEGGREVARATSPDERPLYRGIQEQLVAAVRARGGALDADRLDDLVIAIEIATAGAPVQFAESPRAT